MLMLSRWLLTIGLLVAGTAAGAETVVADKANCRAAARQTSPVLGSLRHGQALPVLSTSGGWSYVDPARLPACWVRSDLLSAEEFGAAPVAPPTSARAARATAARQSRSYGQVSSPRRRAHASGRSRQSRRGGGRGLYDGGDSCPCSGSSICVGPRGGRYCITSGGNKRYGV